MTIADKSLVLLLIACGQNLKKNYKKPFNFRTSLIRSYVIFPVELTAVISFPVTRIFQQIEQ